MPALQMQSKQAEIYYHHHRLNETSEAFWLPPFKGGLGGCLMFFSQMTDKHSPTYHQHARKKETVIVWSKKELQNILNWCYSASSNSVAILEK